jgi:hypothetical protein
MSESKKTDEGLILQQILLTSQNDILELHFLGLNVSVLMSAIKINHLN